MNNLNDDIGQQAEPRPDDDRADPFQQPAERQDPGDAVAADGGGVELQLHPHGVHAGQVDADAGLGLPVDDAELLLPAVPVVRAAAEVLGRHAVEVGDDRVLDRALDEGLAALLDDERIGVAQRAADELGIGLDRDRAAVADPELALDQPRGFVG